VKEGGIVRNRRSLLLLAAWPLFVARPAAAEEAPIPASATETPAEGQLAQVAAAPFEPAPTIESLRAEIRATEARRAQEIQQLRDELARREDETAVAHEREAVERDRAIRLYGFSDFGIMRTIAPESGRFASQFTTPLTFYLGRLNLYFDAHPDPDFRFLAETRFSLYPNGTATVDPSTGTVIRPSTAVGDISSPNSSASVNWGGVILERAVLDWTRYSFFSVRAGLFLTPFGIYNVDHGSPTLIAVALPIYISQGWIPERQMGIQIFGTYPLAPWELGYAATVSNGRTDGILDLGDSKAYGGRIFARRQGELSLAVGSSALYQPYRRNQEQFGLASDNSITFASTRVVERTLLTMGVDLSVDYNGLRLRSELVMVRTKYTPGLRDSPAGAPLGGLSPDSQNVNWSALLAYRWSKLEGYLYSELFVVSPTQPDLTTVWSPGVGLNLYLRPNVILKGAWTHPMFYKDGDPQNLAAKGNFHTFNGLLVWAF
jgi:hypothetical protein